MNILKTNKKTYESNTIKNRKSCEIIITKKYGFDM